MDNITFSKKMGSWSNQHPVGTKLISVNTTQQSIEKDSARIVFFCMEGIIAILILAAVYKVLTW